MLFRVCLTLALLAAAYLYSGQIFLLDAYVFLAYFAIYFAAAKTIKKPTDDMTAYSLELSGNNGRRLPRIKSFKSIRRYLNKYAPRKI
jgi:hypothetical protein